MDTFEQQFPTVAKYLTTFGPCAHADHEEQYETPDKTELYDALRNTKVLVIGAGGLGCEILKDLACTGFANIEVIDMDTIDLSNLNRQFLFREKDIGKAKSEVAAAAVESRIPNVVIKPHVCKVQEKSLAFYRDFDVIIAGLDNLEARRFINGVVFALLEYDSDGVVDVSSQTILLDGGTEGFKGHCRVVVPGDKKSACLDCTLDLFPPQVTYPLCTIANTPRLPEHCIEWAKIIHWPQNYPNVANTNLDGDNEVHINWLYQEALKRADEFGIKGVTYRLTKGVVKNIIPAVASTNAIIAATTVNECFKMVTFSLQGMNSEENGFCNYFLFNQTAGIYSYNMEYERKTDCLICGENKSNEAIEFVACFEDSLEDLIENLKEKFTLRNLSLSFHTGAPIYSANIAQTHTNLEKLLGEIVQVSQVLIVQSDSFINGLKINLVLKKLNENNVN